MTATIPAGRGVPALDAVYHVEDTAFGEFIRLRGHAVAHKIELHIGVGVFR